MELSIGLPKIHGGLGGVKTVTTTVTITKTTTTTTTAFMLLTLNSSEGRTCKILNFCFSLGYFRIRRGTNECSLEDNVVCALPNLNSVNPEYEEVCISLYQTLYYFHSFENFLES